MREGGEAYWDCPNLMGNVGDYCQNGWGTINENCECIVTEENCLTESELITAICFCITCFNVVMTVILKHGFIAV